MKTQHENLEAIARQTIQNFIAFAKELKKILTEDQISNINESMESAIDNPGFKMADEIINPKFELDKFVIEPTDNGHLLLTMEGYKDNKFETKKTSHSYLKDLFDVLDNYLAAHYVAIKKEDKGNLSA
jgi:hypothetical protein